MKIKFDHLSKYFGERCVLDDICFEDEITTLAIIGTSGGGKSTLLRILGGLIPATNGTVSLDGKPVLSASSGRHFRPFSPAVLEYRRQIGFVFQQNGLLKHLTALENICLPLTRVYGYSAGQAQKKALSLLARFGLENERDKYPSSLSGGQSQRIAIARAIAPSPRFLLLDEPTSALDPEYTVDILNMIRELKEDGMHFVIVTHEMGFARHACEKTMFLSNGKILEYGQSESLFLHPETPQIQRFLRNLLEWT